jgi:hypothetical protein
LSARLLWQNSFEIPTLLLSSIVNLIDRAMLVQPTILRSAGDSPILLVALWNRVHGTGPTQARLVDMMRYDGCHSPARGLEPILLYFPADARASLSRIIISLVHLTLSPNSLGGCNGPQTDDDAQVMFITNPQKTCIILPSDTCPVRGVSPCLLFSAALLSCSVLQVSNFLLCS